MANKIVGRLAPSPTGLLHLGNIWAFFLCWLAVRQADGILIMRMDDIDRPRCREDFAKSLIYDLKWLGLDWDCAGPQFTQSKREGLYQEAIAELDKLGQLYPCFCSRKEIRQMASAPHLEDGRVLYPGTCRHMDPGLIQEYLREGRQHALRVKMPGGAFSFTDLVYGECGFQSFGEDFAVKRADNIFSYQFTSALDDMLMGVNLVVRGRDLLDSTPGQEGLKTLLGGKSADYAHVPLLMNDLGERLAKRHASQSIASLRDCGTHPEEIIGSLARLAGLNPEGTPGKPEDFIKTFAWEKLGQKDLVWHNL